MFIFEHLQIKRAVADGYDVRGVLYWTLVRSASPRFDASQTCR